MVLRKTAKAVGHNCQHVFQFANYSKSDKVWIWKLTEWGCKLIIFISGMDEMKRAIVESVMNYSHYIHHDVNDVFCRDS